MDPPSTSCFARASCESARRAVASACSASRCAASRSVRADSTSASALRTAAMLLVSVMETFGCSAANAASACATAARACTTATSRSVGSSSARASPAFTRWLSSTWTAVTVPGTRELTALTFPSIWASSVSSYRRAWSQYRTAARSTTAAPIATRPLSRLRAGGLPASGPGGAFAGPPAPGCSASMRTPSPGSSRGALVPCVGAGPRARNRKVGPGGDVPARGPRVLRVARRRTPVREGIARPTPPRRRAGQTMGKGRLEAFSDGVFAILLTILVLELRIPHGDRVGALAPLVPVFLAYVLSFTNLGIYWSNHHHLLHATLRINGRILWANLHLLFWLSLFPFVTGWMGANHRAPVPTAIYGAVMLAAGLAYWKLQGAIIADEGPGSPLALAVGKDVKGKLSPLAYALAIPLAFLSPWISDALFVAVALAWIVPDPRIERRVSA